MRFCYFPNPEQKYGVVFNVVGKLKGLLRENQYVPVDRLSDLEKVQSPSLDILNFMFKVNSNTSNIYLMTGECPRDGDMCIPERKKINPLQ